MANKVVATRQELMKYKAQKKSLTRGHSLLKDKRDTLVKMFIELYKEVAVLRKSSDSDLIQILNTAGVALADTSPEYLEVLASQSEVDINIISSSEQKLGVRLVNLKHTTSGTLMNYSLLETNFAFDKSLVSLQRILPTLIKLIQKENRLRILAEEVQKTKKRVNALEYKLIPEVNQTIKYIESRLDEAAIQETATLLSIKKNIQE
jgi:V/A-type H+-transporting ATPase subunit D